MISLVIPCYNENEVLDTTCREVLSRAEQWGEDFELLLVDDGSRDNTWDLIEQWTLRDPRVKGARLSRNFGHQAALGAGLEIATGDAVVVLDADLQDPPAVVAEMIDRWRAGDDVVFGQREKREGEGWFKRLTAFTFYRLMDRMTGRPFPRDAGDFALLDRRVVETLLACREQSLYWRGLRAWAGFRQSAVRFERQARAAGQTKYTLRKMLRLATNAIVGFSDWPLRAIAYCGAIALVVACLAAATTMIARLVGGPIADSLAWSFSGLALFFLGSVQLLSLGVAGEYLARIHDEVRGRPRWIVQQTRGFPADATEHGARLRIRREAA